MKPTWQSKDGDVLLYLGDCLQILPHIGRVDAVITSPPYNTGGISLGYHPNSTTGDSFYSEYKDDLTPEKYLNFMCRAIKESMRISRYVFWNMQCLSGNKSSIVEILYIFRKNLKDFFIWEKQAVNQITIGNTAKGFEFIFAFGQDDTMTFAYNNFPSNKYVPNIKTWFKQESIPEHHATFPVALPSYFAQYFTKQNNTILDPFMGSGTTGIACIRTGRKFIGIELDPKYFEISKNRIETELRQPSFRLQYQKQKPLAQQGFDL